ncbi:MAG: chitobiase/beta-hexosaminidase C-terminal domain-containing protein [Clostridia bacterium]|nr:chitobiase/beta-hexosaminidase C-terminal domain-containing protein [Clostridia bacterium]
MKQKWKKLLNVCSVVALVAAIVVSAGMMLFSEVMAGWNGTTATAFASGSGTEANPYVINTQNQLGYFMKQLNAGVTYEGLYIKLDTNLDMTGGKWSVNESASFAGTFLGNNKTLTMDSNFLGTIAATGKVDWLNLKGSGTLSTPLLCYDNNGTIQNCRVSGDVSMSQIEQAALLCLNNNSTGLVVNSCGFGSVYGDSENQDSSCYVGWISKSKGTIKNCYAVLTLEGSAPGSYNKLYTGQITAEGTYENCYGGTDAISYDVSFVAKLNASVGASGYMWTADSSNVNKGYPIIKECLSATTNLSGSAESLVVFHTTTFSATLTSSETGCTIYYTLDGTDPSTSGTRKTYSSPISIEQDTVITSVACKNGVYGVSTRQQIVRLLGAGTTESPYIVSTNKQLYAIRLEPDKVYELNRDLDFTNDPKNDRGANWESIPSFSGELRGGGHSITGLSSVTGGLVDVNNGHIQELRLIDHQLSVSGATESYFGAIANSNHGTITRCYAGADPDADIYTEVTTSAGGIAGRNDGTISYCGTSGTLKLKSSDLYNLISMGGIAGYGTGIVRSCYSNMALYSPKSNHDSGLTIGGISYCNAVYDSRFDGICVIYSYITHYGVGSATGTSRGIFNGGAIFTVPEGTSSKPYYAKETDLYTLSGWKESDYSAFDFDSVWMMTASGPMPQGIMGADGRCMSKYSYTEPTCTANGSAVSYDILNTGYRKTETLPMSDHSYESVVTDPTCTDKGYTTHTCDCGDSYVSDETAALGHTYGSTPEWIWTGDSENGYTAATAKFTCSCGHEETVTAVVSAQTTDATTEAEGQTVYTASVTFNETEHTDTKTVSIPKITVFTVNGTVFSWNDTDDAICLLYGSDVDDAVILAAWKNGGEYGALYTAIKGSITDATVDGKAIKSQTFTFEGVTAGTYKLVLLKPGKYVPKIVEVEVTNEAVDVGQQNLWLYGDVNYDGVINSRDVLQVKRYINTKGSVITTGTADEIAEKIRVCDINGDGVINSRDVLQMKRYINTKGSLFNNFK